MNEVKRSKWFGLWNNSEKHYMISQPIEINSIKEFTDSDKFRLIIKKNKFYEKGGNKPYYCFAIGNCFESANNTITSKEMQYEECIVNEENILEGMNKFQLKDYILEKYGIKLYTYEDVRKAIHGANYDGANGYTDIIVEDYL